MQRRAVVVSWLPSFEQLTFISIEQAGSSSPTFGFRITTVSQPISNRSFTHSDSPGNVARPQTLEMKGENLFIALLSLCFSSQSCLFLSSGSISRALLGRFLQRLLLVPICSICSSLVRLAPGQD